MQEGERPTSDGVNDCSSNRLAVSYSPLNQQSQSTRTSSQTPECPLLVDSVDISSSVQMGIPGTTASTAYCQATICSKNEQSPTSSGHEQASSEDGYRTAAPASRPDCVATGLSVSSPYQSSVDNSAVYQSAAGVSCRPTSQLQGPPQPLPCIYADDDSQL